MRRNTLLVLALSASAALAGAQPRSAVAGRPFTRPAMSVVGAGSYRPLYASPRQVEVSVPAFALDREPVSRADFASFVGANPDWRRDRIASSLAEREYLSDWSTALVPGGPDAAHQPVTNVSLFAARAYCTWQHKRLPTLAEWEHAAAASETVRDASRDPAFTRQLLALYARQHAADAVMGRGFRNAYGIRDLHGLVWEWTLDFSGDMTAHESHDATSAMAMHTHGPGCASAAIGATDPTDYPAFLRYAFRAGLTPRATSSSLGFRCAADLWQSP